MSSLRNVKDLDPAQLPEEVVAQIEAFVKRGYDRNHLVVGESGKVFLDKELAENDAFDEIIYAKNAHGSKSASEA